MQNRNEVGTLKKGLDIFQLLLEHPSLSIQEIIEMLQLNQSTTYRLVSTLEQNHFISKNNNRYEISDTLISKILQKSKHTNYDLTWKSVSFMDKLSQETGETTYIGMMQGTEMMITQAVQGKYATRTHLEVGDRLSLHADAIGKCILAFKEKDEQSRIINSLTFEKRTDHTITSLDLFLEELDRIKKNGYSLDNEEGEIGVRCVSAPIYKGDQVIAAVAISGPSVRVSKEKDEAHVELVKKCAKEISASL
ncbi:MULTISPECIES: IclR family transcriptional regulator [Bacillus]|uniref:IclR family transcriptional regulator n=2 Tax=Bacillus TaxID=1386 RepID=A0A0M5JAP5_9BACI|nr:MULTISPECIES: IclR family transcriptional regulator [Bacillus]ALC83239.1 IclR family transcriptional regulator [Bacillus gobiensis]MBP1084204.1 IclR family KDG regulon transcriptional repressor [Bacillus capparidis]MED1098208.1 IclR family transcriptional regulator [Bacillus capparidis]